MATRKELIRAAGERYRVGTREEKRQILGEFVELTGYHRKHAIRALNRSVEKVPAKRGRRPLYDEAVRQSLIVLWEAADRICGKRLKAALPLLIEAMERHGHIALDAEVRRRLLEMSAATIDRVLERTRGESLGRRTRRGGVNSTLRKSIPIRTHSDWKDVESGYFQTDFVEHCGGITEGTFVHSLVLTDVASGWIECVALPAREQLLVIEAFAHARKQLPFPMRGLNSDNDSTFITQAVVDFCRVNALSFTRSRPYRKNDQAWVEQKNGSVVRRLVGYGRLQGLGATRALARLYEAARLYVNFFQPSFKLESKSREGSHVTKRYFPPATPCDRLLASGCLTRVNAEQLRQQQMSLDPVALLHEIRQAQEALARFVANGSSQVSPAGNGEDLAAFLRGLGTAWKDKETRPTHRSKTPTPHWWRSREDPFEHTWPTVQQWLSDEPGVSAKDLMNRLGEMFPDVYASKAQLRTLQRRVKAWRAERAKELIFGVLKQADSHADASESTEEIP